MALSRPADTLQTFYIRQPGLGIWSAWRGVPLNPSGWFIAPRHLFKSCQTRAEAENTLRYGLEVEART